MLRIFSTKEHDIFLGLDPAFAAIVIPLADKANELCEHEDCSVYVQSGFRDISKQMEHWRKGRAWDGERWKITGSVVTFAQPGKSPHQYGHAVHLALLEDDSKEWLHKDDQRWHSIVGVNVRDAGLRWGGDFSNMFDAAHIESRGWRKVAESNEWRGL